MILIIITLHHYSVELRVYCTITLDWSKGHYQCTIYNQNLQSCLGIRLCYNIATLIYTTICSQPSKDLCFSTFKLAIEYKHTDGSKDIQNSNKQMTLVWKDKLKKHFKSPFAERKLKMWYLKNWIITLGKLYWTSNSFTFLNITLLIIL